MRRIAPIVLGLAIAIAVAGGWLLGTDRAAATSHLRFDPAPAGLEWTAGFANSDVLAEGTGGTGTLSYTLLQNDGSGGTQALPTGFRFVGANRRLSSTTDVSTANSPYSLVYTVTDDNQVSATATFTVTVNEAPLVSPGDLGWTAKHANSDMLPAASGGTEPLSYTLLGERDSTLPTGFSFDESERKLTSTDTVDTGNYSLVYTVTDDNEASYSATFKVTVAAAVELVSDDPGDLGWTAGHANTAVTLPAGTGGTGTLSYSVVEFGTDALPTGFVFNSSDRKLSSTTDVSTANSPYSLVYTVTDDNEASYSADFDVTVNEAVSLVSDDPGDLGWTAGHANTAVTLPAGTGGTGTLSYSVVEFGTDALPTGFVFNSSDRKLSSTTDVSTANSPYSLVYTVTDDNEASYSADFDVTVNEAVSLVSDDPGDLGWTAGHANTAVTLPAGTGGTGTLSYTLVEFGTDAAADGVRVRRVGSGVVEHYGL